MNKSLSRPNLTRDEKERIALKIRLLQLGGLTFRDLAEMTGKDTRHVANVLCGNTSSWPVKSAINQALGEKIFSRPAASSPRRRRKSAPATLPGELKPLPAILAKPSPANGDGSLTTQP